MTGLLAAACLLTGAQAAGAVGWRPAETIPGSSVGNEWWVPVVSDAAGDVVAAWPSAPPPAHQWLAATSDRPAGGAWSGQAQLGTPMEGTPAIAGNAAGDVIEAYAITGARPAGDALWVAQREPGGTWQTTPVNAPVPNGVYTDEVNAAIDAAGDAVVVWETSLAGSDYQAEIATRSGLHGAWSVRPLGTAGRVPAVAMDAAGDAAVVYSVVQGSDFVVYGTYRAAGQSSFGAPLLLSSPSENANFYPSVAIGARGDVLASWAGSGFAHVRYRSAATQSWQSVQTLPTNAGEPAVAVGDDGSAIAVWNQPDTPDHVGVWGMALDPSGTWSTQAPWWTGASSGVAFPPAVRIDHAGTATIAFGGDDGGGDPWAVFGLRRSPNGTLSSPVELGSADLAAGAKPQLALDARGDAIATWPVRTTGAVASAAYVAAPPTIASVTVPGGATAGAAVPLSATASDPFGGPLTLHWEFGDGQSADGASVAHAWAAPGAHTVTLTVTDASGAASSAQRTITVVPAAGSGGPGPGPGSTPPPGSRPAPKPDRTKPALALAQPACPKHAKAKACRRYRATARAWRTLAGTVKDASGVRSLTATLTSGKGRHCRILVAGGKLHAAACAKAKPVNVRIGRGGAFKLTVKKLSAGTWTLTLHATDKAGNVTTLRRTLKLK